MPDQVPLSPDPRVEQFLHEAMSEETVERFVKVLDDGILAGVPELASDPALVEELHLSTRSQWLAFLGAVGTDAPTTVPPEARVLPRTVARRGLDPTPLIRGHRIAHRIVFDFLDEMVVEVFEEPQNRHEAVVGLWRRANEMLDASVDAMLESFYAERADMLEGTLRRKTEIIESLLGAADLNADEASVALGHHLRHWQTGLAVWTPVAGRNTRADLHRAADAAATTLEAPSPLTLAAGSRELWCWVATTNEPDLDRLVNVDPLLREHGLHLAVGLPAPGKAGFSSSNEEARAAQALVMRFEGAPTLIRYDEVDLLCLTSGNEVLMSRMVQREIGPLLGDAPTLRTLRHTALVYLAKRMSADAAATALFVHKNTVRYRVSRIEELLGHPLGERTSHVELALRYADLFDPPPDN